MDHTTMTRTITRYTSIAVVALAGLLSACGTQEVPNIAGPSPNSRIRFFNFGVNAPSVNFYANNTKMTAIQSTTGTEATTGIAYGGVAAGGAYSTIDPGQYALTGKIAGQTQTDFGISTVNQSVKNGKNNSFSLTGIY